MERKITRIEFLKIAGFTAFTILILPGLKKLKLVKTTHKEARYYKTLAG